MKRTVSGISTFLLIMIFAVSVFNLPMRAGSRNSGLAILYGENEETPKYGGTLRVGLPRAYAPLTLNPLLDYVHFYNCYPFFSSLLVYDENCSLQPDLAESYEMSEDGLNLTFHLYENVSWHDGVEFNASDVKFTFDTIRDDPNVWWWWKTYASDVNSTEMINDSTIVFHLNEPKGSITGYLSLIPIIPRHIYEGTDLTTNPANENPIGTGPFKFESWTIEENLTVTANEEYFTGRPFLDSVFYRWDITPRENLTIALENNVIDVVPEDVAPSRIRNLQETTGTSVVTREAASYCYIVLNATNPILQRLNVRQALAHAINKTKITTEAYYGYATAAKGPLPSSLGKWYNPNVIDYEFNKTLAEELLDNDYPRGLDGWRFSFVIKSAYSAGTVWRANALYMIRDDLRSVGINATVEFGVPLEEGASGNFDDAFCAGWIYDALGPDDLFNMFHSNAYGNFGGYSNATLDTLLEEGRSSFNETLRKMDFDRAQEIIAQDLSRIFLYHPHSAVAYNNDFHGRISTPPVNLRFTSYFLEYIWYDPTLSGKGHCPYRVCFIDSEGRRTGYHDGTAYEDIPDSTYSGMDSDPQLVKIREPTGIYTVELFGTENASYKFEFANIALEYKDVWIPEGFIHEGETITYVVKVYGDGSIKVYDQDKFSPHDIGIRGMAFAKTVVGQNYSTNLNATVFNWGDSTEHFNVTFYANTTIIDTVTDVVLLSGEHATRSFTWDTTGFAKGNYTLWVYVSPVLGELDQADNNCTTGVFAVTIPGDVTGEGMCDMQDISIMIDKFMNAPAYDPNVDVNNDSAIDMADISIAIDHFMQS